MRPFGGESPCSGQAANEKQPEIARILIENGADVNAGEAADPPRVMWGGSTALDHAAWMDSVAVAEVLIDHNADLNRHGAEHFAPLIAAAVRGSEGVAKLLLEKGANPNVTDVDGNTPLLEAADAGHQSMVELLIAHGGVPLPRYREVSVDPRAEMPYLGLHGKYRSKMLVMKAMTPEDARAYFNRWELVRDAEAAELRRATMETKLQQLAALMASRHLFGPEPDREAQVQEVRDRWARLRRALGG